MTVISIANAPHYRWGEVCDGWHLVREADLSVIQERVPPGAGEVRHRHRRARQFFYVLTGAAELEVEGVVHRLTPGEGLAVAPGDAHRLRNPGPAALTFLVTSTPPSHGDRETL